MKNPTKSAPVIGITLDFEQGGKPGNFSKMPHYAVRENYCTSVSGLGAVALPLPHDVKAVDAYLGMIDGLMITGGGFDVSPEYYGEKIASDTVTLKDARTAFEFAITKGAIARNLPILGICGGEQLLNVVLGGTLIQHIPDTIAGALEHEQKNARSEPGHDIAIVPGTLLHRIAASPSPLVGEGRDGGVMDEANIVAAAPRPNPPPQGGRELIFAVNTAHHQAVAKLAQGAIANASTSDGVIEGFELPSHPFCLGVQWHPEYFVSPIDRKIFEAFVVACENRLSEK